MCPPSVTVHNQKQRQPPPAGGAGEEMWRYLHPERCHRSANKMLWQRCRSPFPTFRGHPSTAVPRHPAAKACADASKRGCSCMEEHEGTCCHHLSLHSKSKCSLTLSVSVSVLLRAPLVSIGDGEQPQRLHIASLSPSTASRESWPSGFGWVASNSEAASWTTSSIEISD